MRFHSTGVKPSQPPALGAAGVATGRGEDRTARRWNAGS